ncbi:MAG: GLPGLI family protein [Bacteroidota bacterium]
MPRFILALVGLLLLLPTLLAQTEFQGQINYLEIRTIVLPDDLPEEAKEAMAAHFGEGGMQDRATLSFDANQSLYRPAIAPEETTEENGTTTIVIRRIGQDQQYYTNWKEGKIVYANNILDQGFLIEDDWETIDWQLDETTPMSMDYQLPARRATATTPSGEELIAWYTSAVPLPIGPRNYGGLPGAIVHLEMTDGEDKTTYRLESIELAEEAPEITIPTEGRKTDMATFRKQREERLNRDGGRIMIRRDFSTDDGGF